MKRESRTKTNKRKMGLKVTGNSRKGPQTLQNVKQNEMKQNGAEIENTFTKFASNEMTQAETKLFLGLPGSPLNQRGKMTVN
jgi:hypothetical protein